MADGSKKEIQEVEIGDEVLTYDTKTGEQKQGKVTKLENPIDKLYSINEGMIETTADHPFYTKKDGEKVWAALDKELTLKRMPYLYFVKELEVGDKILTQENEWITVRNIKEMQGNHSVYNLLGITNNPNFYVNGLLVHNRDTCPTYSPVADIKCTGPDGEICLEGECIAQETITCDGSDSNDPDSCGTGGMSYSWEIKDTGDNLFTTDSGSEITFTPNIAGEWKVELEVTDNDGETDTKTQAFEVNTGVSDEGTDSSCNYYKDLNQVNSNFEDDGYPAEGFGGEPIGCAFITENGEETSIHTIGDVQVDETPEWSPEAGDGWNWTLYDVCENEGEKDIHLGVGSDEDDSCANPIDGECVWSPAYMLVYDDSEQICESCEYLQELDGVKGAVWDGSIEDGEAYDIGPDSVPGSTAGTCCGDDQDDDEIVVNCSEVSWEVKITYPEVLVPQGSYSDLENYTYSYWEDFVPVREKIYTASQSDCECDGDICLYDGMNLQCNSRKVIGCDPENYDIGAGNIVVDEQCVETTQSTYKKLVCNNETCPCNGTCEDDNCEDDTCNGCSATGEECGTYHEDCGCSWSEGDWEYQDEEHWDNYFELLNPDGTVNDDGEVFNCRCTDSDTCDPDYTFDGIQCPSGAMFDGTIISGGCSGTVNSETQKFEVNCDLCNAIDEDDPESYDPGSGSPTWVAEIECGETSGEFEVKEYQTETISGEGSGSVDINIGSYDSDDVSITFETSFPGCFMTDNEYNDPTVTSSIDMPLEEITTEGSDNPDWSERFCYLCPAGDNTGTASEDVNGISPRMWYHDQNIPDNRHVSELCCGDDEINETPDFVNDCGRLKQGAFCWESHINYDESYRELALGEHSDVPSDLGDSEENQWYWTDASHAEGTMVDLICEYPNDNIHQLYQNEEIPLIGHEDIWYFCDRSVFSLSGVPEALQEEELLQFQKNISNPLERDEGSYYCAHSEYDGNSISFINGDVDTVIPTIYECSEDNVAQVGGEYFGGESIDEDTLLPSSKIFQDVGELNGDFSNSDIIWGHVTLQELFRPSDDLFPTFPSIEALVFLDDDPEANLIDHPLIDNCDNKPCLIPITEDTSWIYNAEGRLGNDSAMGITAATYTGGEFGFEWIYSDGTQIYISESDETIEIEKNTGDYIGGGYCSPEVDGNHCGVPGTTESTWHTWGVAIEDADEQKTKCSEGSMTKILYTLNPNTGELEKVGFLCQGDVSSQTKDLNIIGGGYCVENSEDEDCSIEGEDGGTWEFWGVGEHKENGGHCLQGDETDSLEGENGIVGFLCAVDSGDSTCDFSSVQGEVEFMTFIDEGLLGNIFPRLMIQTDQNLYVYEMNETEHCNLDILARLDPTNWNFDKNPDQVGENQPTNIDSMEVIYDPGGIVKFFAPKKTPTLMITDGNDVYFTYAAPMRCDGDEFTRDFDNTDENFCAEQATTDEYSDGLSWVLGGSYSDDRCCGEPEDPLEIFTTNEGLCLRGQWISTHTGEDMIESWPFDIMKNNKVYGDRQNAYQELLLESKENDIEISGCAVVDETNTDDSEIQEYLQTYGDTTKPYQGSGNLLLNSDFDNDDMWEIHNENGDIFNTPSNVASILVANIDSPDPILRQKVHFIESGTTYNFKAIYQSTDCIGQDLQLMYQVYDGETLIHDETNDFGESQKIKEGAHERVLVFESDYGPEYDHYVGVKIERGNECVVNLRNMSLSANDYLNDLPRLEEYEYSAHDADDLRNFIDNHEDYCRLKDLDDDDMWDYYCSFREKWEKVPEAWRDQTEIADTEGFSERKTIELKTIPEDWLDLRTEGNEYVDPSIQIAGCCIEDQCWNGERCVNSSHAEPRPTLYPNTSSRIGYRCMFGEWEDANLKWDWTNEDNKYGYCNQSSQCLVDYAGEWNETSPDEFNMNEKILNTGTENPPQMTENPRCIDDEEYIQDHYCDGGEWTTRTSILIEEMLEYADGEFTFFCDTPENALNRIDYYTDSYMDPNGDCNNDYFTNTSSNRERYVENAFFLNNFDVLTDGDDLCVPDCYYRESEITSDELSDRAYPCVNTVCVLSVGSDDISRYIGTTLNQEIDAEKYGFGILLPDIPKNYDDELRTVIFNPDGIGGTTSFGETVEIMKQTLYNTVTGFLSDSEPKPYEINYSTVKKIYIAEKGENTLWANYYSSYRRNSLLEDIYQREPYTDDHLYIDMMYQYEGHGKEINTTIDNLKEYVSPYHFSSDPASVIFHNKQSVYSNGFDVWIPMTAELRPE